MTEIISVQQTQEHVDEADYLALLDEMDRIAAFPLESPPQSHLARDHDAVLYPKKARCRDIR